MFFFFLNFTVILLSVQTFQSKTWLPLPGDSDLPTDGASRPNLNQHNSKSVCFSAMSDFRFELGV